MHKMLKPKNPKTNYQMSFIGE